MKKKVFDSYIAYQFYKWFTAIDLIIVTTVTIIGYITGNDSLKKAPVIGLALFFACHIVINLLREFFGSQEKEKKAGIAKDENLLK